MKITFRTLLAAMAVLGLGLGGGFGGGAAYGRRSAPNAATPANGGASASASPTPVSGAQGGAGGRIAGVVEQVDGDTITLRTQGGSVSVTLQQDTSLRQLKDGSRSDLRAGATVTIVGQPDADGYFEASQIQIGDPTAQGGRAGSTPSPSRSPGASRQASP